MKEFKNIDELFKNELSGFELEPDNKVWEGFKKSAFYRRRTYFREILVVAALLLLCSSIIGYFIIKEHDHDNITVVENNSKLTKTSDNQSHIVENDIVVNNKTETNINIEKKDGEPIIDKSSLNDNNITEPIDKHIEYEDKITKQQIHSEIPRHYSFISLSRLFGKYSLINTSTDTSIYNRDRVITDISDYIERKRKFKIYTGANASVGMMYYSNTPDQFTWSSNLVLGYSLNNFYLESGIGYRYVKQHGDYRIAYESKDSVGYYQEVLSFELNPNDPDEIFYNTKTKTVYDSVVHYTHQSPLYSYNYIEIPITIGFNIFKTNNLKLSAQASFTYSYLNSINEPIVTYSQPETKLVNIINYTPERTKNNFSAGVALRASYRIHNSISISLQPEFSSYLNSIYKDSYSVSRPYRASLRAGILFNF